MSDQVEGRRPVVELLRTDRPVEAVLVAAGSREAGAVAEIRRLAESRGVEVRDVPRRRIEELARTRTPQGVIALVPAFRYAELDDPLRRARERGEPVLLVALDGITDPQNLGAIARSAEAAGAHGLLLPQRRSAHVTASAEKASAGALAHLPVVIADNLGRALGRLQDQGVWVVALDGEAETVVWDLPVASEPLCLVVGAEDKGVSRLIRERADLRGRIPMGGRVGSLNASAAAAVALFEVARHRCPGTSPASDTSGSGGGN